MPRHVFFSFHYADSKSTGFYDKSLWEEAKKKGDAAIKRLIDKGLENTSVTCFLIGEETHKRKYCKYELEQSLELGKGILGILLPNQVDHGPNGSANMEVSTGGTTTGSRNG